MIECDTQTVGRKDDVDQEMRKKRETLKRKEIVGEKVEQKSLWFW